MSYIFPVRLKLFPNMYQTKVLNCYFSHLEKRYQDQIKVLQSELEHERETMMHQSSKQRQTMEKEIQILKEEETKLKEKLNITQKVNT